MSQIRSRNHQIQKLEIKNKESVDWLSALS